MPTERATPTSTERPFEIGELFFSTTDRKGIIRSGNDVFTRVSAFTEVELIGQPHNIIRHPDMPRAVFQLLWDYLEAGLPIAAYVKNMAKNGDYYWVLATVVSVGDGYLSVRLKPSSELLPAVEALYATLRGIERDIETAGGTPKEAIAASTAHLLGALPQLGFADYDAFMRSALPTEIRSRQVILGRSAIQASHASRQPQFAGMEDVLAACHTLHAFLYGRFSDLDRYAALHDAFVDGSASVLKLANDTRLFALNAQLSAARLCEAGAALGIVAGLMRKRSDATAATVEKISGEIDAAVSALGALSFDVSMATLQSEMVSQFIVEFAESRDRDAAAGAESSDGDDVLSANVGALAACLKSSVAPLLEALAELTARLHRVSDYVGGIGWELKQLEALQIAGRVETARLQDAADSSLLFEEIRTQVAAGKRDLRKFDILRAARAQAPTEYEGHVVGRSLVRIQEWAASVTINA